MPAAAQQTARRRHRRPRRRRGARSEVARPMIEVKVVDSLTLPDMALVRLTDPKGESVDIHPLQLGKDIEIKVGATGERATTSIFKGQIVAVEPEFTREGRASSRSAPTTRRTSSTASARRARSSRCRPATWSRRSPARPA